MTASTGGDVSTHLVSGNDVPVETGTTSVSLSAYGMSVLAAATGAERIYTLPAPTRAGQRKSLLAITSPDHVVTSTGGYTIGTTGGSALTITGLATDRSRGAELIARSTTQYLIAAYSQDTTGSQLVETS